MQKDVNKQALETNTSANNQALREAMFGPIDPLDPESWPVELKNRGWTAAREAAYQERVAVALIDHLRTPARFYPSRPAYNSPQSIRTAMAAQSDTRDRHASEDEDDEAVREERGEEMLEESAGGDTLTAEQHESLREWAAEKLLELYALDELYAAQFSAQVQDDADDDASTEEEQEDHGDSVDPSEDGDAREDADVKICDDEGSDQQKQQAAAQSVPPLVVTKPKSRGSYPLDSFGQYAEAVEQIARIVQVAPTMAGTALIGVLSPLAQPLINVSHKALDSGMPVTVNVLCVAESGERKSSLLSALTKPILKGIQAAGNGRSGMMTNDITVDGLIKGLINRCPSQYILAPEAVTLLGSHALSEEARGRFFGTSSSLYSDEPLSRTRADEHVFVVGRRLSLTLFGQPVVIREFLGSALVMQQGTANRFLIAKPASLRGQRVYCDEELDGHPEYVRLTGRLYELASQPWHIDEDTGGIVPRVVRLTPEAKALWVPFYNHLEREIGKGGRYDDYPGYVGRFSEQVLRIAALLALLDDTQVTHIDGETMRRALDLGEYYLRQALKVFMEMAAPN